MILSTPCDKFRIGHVDAHDPRVEQWHAEYCRKYSLGYTAPLGDTWYGVFNGERLLAASGEASLYGTTVKVMSLLCEPSREGLEALYELLAVYVEISITSQNVIAEVLAANRSMQRRIERVAGKGPIGLIYLLQKGA